MVDSILPDNRGMTTRRLAAATVAAMTLAAAGCGGSSGTISRPIETVIYVSGGTGLQFSLASAPDAGACGSNGTGIQSPNADHQFADRVFRTPYLFVLENVRQPVRAVIQNLSTLPIRVDTFLGQVPQNSNVTINPGECQSVVTNEALALPTPMPTPAFRGPEIRVDVCAPQVFEDGQARLDLMLDCDQSTADWNWGFFSSIGDVLASNISNCQVPALPPFLLDACQSPATYFMESPRDQVDVAMTVNPGQDPGGQNPTTAQVRVELFVNDQRVAVDAGVEAIVSGNL
jgi:hypothetical protein